MSDSDLTQLYKRHTTRHRGVSYRLRADGSRLYDIRWQNTRVSKRPDGTPLTTEKEALEFQAELRQRSGKGEKIVVNSKITFSELAENWYQTVSRTKQPATLSSYRQGLDLVLLPRFGGWKLGQIDADAIAKLIRDLEREGLHAIDPKRPLRPLSANTIKNYLKPLQGVLKHAVRRSLIPSSPFSVLGADERPQDEDKEPPFDWTEAEIAALLDVSALIGAGRQGNRSRDYTPILRLAALLGLRIGEILALRWQDFEKDVGLSGLLHVRHNLRRDRTLGPTKTKAGKRDLPLSPELRDELIALKLASAHSQEGDFIFATKSGQALDYRNVYRSGWEAARDAAGLPGHLSLHQLRHAAASRLIAAGVDPVTVAAFLGHKDVRETLNTYAHLFDKQDKHQAILLALAGAAQT